MRTRVITLLVGLIAASMPLLPLPSAPAASAAPDARAAAWDPYKAVCVSGGSKRWTRAEFWVTACVKVQKNADGQLRARAWAVYRGRARLVPEIGFIRRDLLRTEGTPTTIEAARWPVGTGDPEGSINRITVKLVPITSTRWYPCRKDLNYVGVAAFNFWMKPRAGQDERDPRLLLHNKLTSRKVFGDVRC